MNYSRYFKKVILLILILVLASIPVRSIELREQVSTFTLDNGFRVIMVEKQGAPVIHFRLMFDVGGVDEPEGLGGIAHMVEHMAFKGTTSVGTDNFKREQELLVKMDQAAEDYFSAREEDMDDEEVTELKEEFTAAQKKAQQLADPNPLKGIFDKHGAEGYNAATGYDHTSYFLSLPANRLELFSRIKADVIENAVFRYFYEEVDVVKEERVQRNEDEPTGFLRENFLQEAFVRHFYGRPLIGSMEEIDNYRRQEALDFWNDHYHPNRAVLVMVGDVSPQEDIKIIEDYFGEISAGPEKKTYVPFEPLQMEERRTRVTFDAEPQMFIGYHIPTYPDQDAYVMDVVSSVLGTGRTSRLYRRLVIEEEVAANVSTSTGIPGYRYPNLFTVHVVTKGDHNPEEVEELVYEEIEKLKEEKISEWELQKVKNQVRANYIRELDSSSGLAYQMAFYEHFLDGWENMKEYPDKIISVTKEQIQQIADEYLLENNRTVAILEKEEGGSNDE